jgi:predicted TIM-barrel fold metal-dependent hydrolase
LIIDTNANLSRWPFRRVAGDETHEFVARMRKYGVAQAWVGSFDGLLHRDVSGVNARLAADCQRHGAGLLVPFGTVNPKLPDWQEDLRRCHEVHRMPGIRLHPNYHGYTLTDPEFAEVLRRAAQLRLLVELVVQMEDERTQYPLMRIPPVNLAPLADIVRTVPALRLVVLNAGRNPYWKQIVAAGDVYFDIAMVERVRGVAQLAADIGPERVVFGSHFPLFYFESATLKLREAGFSEAEAKMISEDNARRLLTAARGTGSPHA